MSTIDSEELTRQRNALMTEIKEVGEWYDRNVKMIISIPLFINAGAVVALAAFFEKGTPDILIKYAVFCFMAGLVFGIFTLIFEFLSSFYKKYALNDCLSSVHKHLTKREMEELSKVLNQRYKNCGMDRVNNVSVESKLRIMNVLGCIISCLLGIFFAANHVSNTYLPFASVILVLYFLGALGWLLCHRKSN